MNLVREQAAYRNSAPSMLGRGISSLTNPIAKSVAGFVPSAIVEGLLRGMDRAAGAPTLIGMDHDTTDLEACRREARRVERVAKTAGAATGAATGFGGAVTMSLDIPATMAVALRNIRTTAWAYGYRDETETERLFRLRILELAALDDDSDREACIAGLEAAIGPGGELVVADDWQVAPLVDQAVERVSRAIAFSAARSRTGMIVPLVGSAVGALVNASFQGDVSRAARFAYQTRRLRAAGTLDL